jgi:RNA polymerase sigma-70 factor (ECF subfamily)
MLRDGDAALDVVQDGFAQALDRRRTFRREGSLEGWIWRIVLNVARDRLRARRGGLAREPAAPEELHVGPDLRKRLLALPERQRLAIFLHYYADMSYEQIAEALGVTTGTVAASLSAARSALREALERELVG